MSDQNGNGAAGGQPQMNVLAQYIKDLSFENPNSPRSLAPQQQSPNISIQVNVNANQIDQTDFEVSLMIEGSAGEGAGLLFQFELNYAGLFRLVNIPAADLHPVVMIECPRLIFPFARQIIADAVRNGGFPPLMLEPIDFVGLYRQRLEAEGAPANMA
jgi:preprotein translocase subunit SecB